MHSPANHADEEVVTPDERTRLLGENSISTTDRVSPRIARRLYVSHFLSTWNSRVFEFGAVLYLAKIYPGTLLPMSLYALTRGLSAMLFAPAVGRYIDGNDRLKVVRASIIYQRLAVAASCALFYVLYADLPLPGNGHVEVLVLVTLLACVEKLSAIINMVSVEKDWVVVLAQDNTAALSTLNSQIRRIDLLCKLLGPLFIALIDSISTDAAILTNLAMNVASVVVEYYAIARIYHEVPDLQARKANQSRKPRVSFSEPERISMLARAWRAISTFLQEFISDFAFYCRHRTFLPSVAGALLYLTVLNFAGQMVTYLISSGYSTAQIGVARTFSVTFEVIATWVAPWLISRIGPLRAGFWLSICQVLPLIAGLIVFWVCAKQPLVSASGLVLGTIISRLGLRGFDLCTQIIVQEEVEAESRGKFSSIEAAFQNAFELLSYMSTIVFFRPTEFQWPSLISVSAVTSASLLYTAFVGLRGGLWSRVKR